MCFRIGLKKNNFGEVTGWFPYVSPPWPYGHLCNTSNLRQPEWQLAPGHVGLKIQGKILKNRVAYHCSPHNINSNSWGIPYFRQTNATETSSWLWERGWWNTCLFPNHSTFRMQLSLACEYALESGQKSDAIAELPESHLFSGQKETIERLEQIPRSIHQTS